MTTEEGGRVATTVAMIVGRKHSITADERGRALREDGTPIEGLYAVGNAAVNAFGTFYPGPGAPARPLAIAGICLADRTMISSSPLSGEYHGKNTDEIGAACASHP